MYLKQIQKRKVKELTLSLKKKNWENQLLQKMSSLKFKMNGLVKYGVLQHYYPASTYFPTSMSESVHNIKWFIIVIQMSDNAPKNSKKKK
uniref:CSON002305 protein n=1 Tax=Culicoides sonorensis TaxID=179676 RepID=A0A336MK38_CULSO